MLQPEGWSKLPLIGNEEIFFFKIGIVWYYIGSLN